MALRNTFLGMAVIYVFIPLSSGFGQTGPDWAEKLDYRPDEVHKIKLQSNSIPLVEVKVNGSLLWVIFNTGCGTGFSLTTAMVEEIAYEVTGRSTERNPDGSYRGETTLATINSRGFRGDLFLILYDPGHDTVLSRDDLYLHRSIFFFDTPDFRSIARGIFQHKAFRFGQVKNGGFAGYNMAYSE